MQRMKDKVVLVTGAGSGIGRATAKLLADEGATVIVARRREIARSQVAGRVMNTSGGMSTSGPGR